MNKHKAPWHLYLVGSLFILIYSIGVYDYINIHTNNLNYITSLGARGDVVGYFSDYPLPFTALWTINVFGGPTAAIALLFRRAWAVWAALAVVAAKSGLDALTFLFRDRWDLFGPQMSLTDLTVLLISLGFFFYCRAMANRGVLT
jgi:lipid-A-disaccharide synthase-like uncharacterized protein